MRHIYTPMTRGFTLIELLVVIAIIGILSSVVLASLNTARLKSRDTRRISDIRQIQNALALYADSNNNLYPGTIASLVPAYLPVVPTDPSTGAIYKYAAIGPSTTCSTYHLAAILEDATNPALLSDVDALSATRCVASGIIDFRGDSTGCTLVSGTDKCYDVKP